MILVLPVAMRAILKAASFASVPDVSVIAAPYGRAGNVLGTLAVVGPTRMNYARVIPLVDFTAREISRALGREG